jgi:nucleotide-binding universal stress UspA family protein
MIKVLLPTDFSVQSEFAYIMVQKMAEKAEMEVTFLHVMSVPDTVTLGADGEVNTCGEIDVDFVVAQKEIAERKLENLQKLHGDHLKTDLVFGKVTTAVVDYAEQHNFDLIAMGTKGATGWKEVFSGSEAQMIARHSRVPLLTLMCDRSDLEIKNILLVHDANDNASGDLTLLKKFIEVFGTKVHLLHIAGSNNAQEHADAKAKLEAFAAEQGLKDVETHVLTDADVEEGVIHFNQMNNMDIVCIGTHQKAGIFRSSAAERLVNHMFKPLITYKLS